jgi:hypothetical protein
MTDGKRASPARGWQAYPPAPRPQTAPTARRWGRRQQRDAKLLLHPGPRAPHGQGGCGSSQQCTSQRDQRAFGRQQHQHMWRAGTHGAQHGQFAAAFIQPRQHHGHQAGQAHQGHQAADGQQRLFTQAHGGPQLVQRHTGQHGQQWLCPIAVDKALHVEHRHTVFQPHQRGRHLLGLQVELARHFGGNLHPRRRRQRCATHPIEMDGLYRLQTDMHRAVHRCAGAGQYTHHGEGLVGVFGGQRAANVCIGAQPVCQRDALTELVAQGLCHLGTQHGFIQTVQRAGEGAALRQRQRLPLTIRKVHKVLGRGAQHRVAAVAVSQGQRHDPGHGAVLGNGTHAVHADVVGGTTHPENRIQHQLHGPGAGAHHQVGAADRLRKAAADVGAQPLQAQQQRGGQCDGQDHQGQRATPVQGTACGDGQQGLHADAATVETAARFSPGSDSRSSKRCASRSSWLTKISVLPAAVQACISRAMKSSRSAASSAEVGSSAAPVRARR